MKKILFLVTLALMPMLTFAGKYSNFTYLEYDETTDLWWLQDYTDATGTTKIGERYVHMNGTVTTQNAGTLPTDYFFKDSNFRPNLRKKLNVPDSPYVTESQFNDITSFPYLTTGSCIDYKGIEYFQNMETIIVPMYRSANPRNNGTIVLDFSKNKLLKTIKFTGKDQKLVTATEMGYLKELNISNTKVTSLDLLNASYMTKLTMDNTTELSDLTLPSVKLNLQEFSMKDATTTIPQLNFTDFTALKSIDLTNTNIPVTCANNPNLEKVVLDGNTIITAINLSSSQKLNYFSCVGATAFGMSYTDWPSSAPTVRKLYANATGSGIQGETFCIGGYSGLAEIEPIEIFFDCYSMSGVEELVIDRTTENDKTADASPYTNLKKLTLIGCKDLSLASGLTELTLDISQSPDLPIESVMSEVEKSATTLQRFTYIDMDPAESQKTFHMNDVFTQLTHMEVKGHMTSVIPPHTVEYFTARETSIETLDLTDLTTLRELDLSESDKLSSLTMPTESGTTLTKLVLRGCESLGAILGTTFGTSYTNLEYVDISRTNHAGNKVLNDVVIGYTYDDNGKIAGDNIVNDVKTLDLTHLTKLKELYVAMCPIEYLNVSGLQSLKKLELRANRDYKGDFMFNNDYETLRKLDVSGCTQLTKLLLSYGDKAATETEGIQSNTTDDQPGISISASESQNYQYLAIEDIDAHGCIRLNTISIYNSPLQRLNVQGCTSLSQITCIQGMMTTEAFERSGISACSSLKQFIAHRNLFTNVDFITVPGTYNGGGDTDFRRTDEGCATLQQLMVNGGSWIRKYPKVTTDASGKKTAVVDRSRYDVKETYTCRITNLDLSHLTDLGQLFCADNLLRTLNFIPEHKGTLYKMEISNNRFTQLDMSNVNASRLLLNAAQNDQIKYDWANHEIDHQVTFRELGLIKGDLWRTPDGRFIKIKNSTRKIREDGENDMIVLNLPFAKSEHEQVQDFSIKHEDANYYAMGDLYNETVEGDDGLMDIISFDVEKVDAEGNVIIDEETGDPVTEKQYFMVTHDGDIHKAGDIDLHRKVGHYSINTNMDTSANSDGNPAVPALSNLYSFVESNKPSKLGNYEQWDPEDAETFAKAEEEFKNMNVKIHLEPYVVYMHPATRTAESEAAGVNFYSGTLCLSYEWRVPRGLQAFVITGVQNVQTMTEDGEVMTEDQLHMIKIGDEGDIIPKLVPVYLRTVPAFDDVVKADETTPARRFTKDPDTGVETEVAAGAEGYDTAKSHVAGFYAMHKNWDPEYLGWNNNKGLTTDLTRLYINKVRRDNHNVAQEGYYTNPDTNEPCCKPVIVNGETKYYSAADFKTNVLDANLLHCNFEALTDETDATYYDSFDPEVKWHYTFDYQNLPRWQCMTLGNESKAGTNIIGFWIYQGTQIAPHRCYLVADELGLEESSAGMSFYFEPDVVTSEVTGIKDVVTTPVVTNSDTWYTLSGARLQGKPQQTGVYINNGKKVYIK